jgi:hypothetical protein
MKWAFLARKWRNAHFGYLRENPVKRSGRRWVLREHFSGERSNKRRTKAKHLHNQQRTGSAYRGKTSMPLFLVFESLACFAGLAGMERSRRAPDQEQRGLEDLHLRGEWAT